MTLIGGDTTRGPRNLCLTIIGELPAGTALARAGARAGDDVYVSGTLGDAALALAGLERRMPMDGATLATLRPRLERPEPRVALGRACAALRRRRSTSPTASPAICSTSSMPPASARRSSSRAFRGPAPLDVLLHGGMRSVALACLLAGGDDYELCFTAPSAHRAALEAVAGDLGLALTRIGMVTAEPGLRVHDEQGAQLADLPRAFDHFR